MISKELKIDNKHTR